MDRLLSDAFAYTDELRQDLERVSDTVTPRHRRASAVLTWATLHEMREDVVSDLSLAARWPFDLLLDLTTTDPAPPAVAAAVTAEEAANLVGVTRLIYERFESGRP